MSVSSLEFQFDLLWEELFPDIDLVAEYRAIPQRRYKFDYAHINSKILIELNGGTWSNTKMGHSSPSGIRRDAEKNNLAIVQGYSVFVLTSDMITDEWLKAIALTIKNRSK